MITMHDVGSSQIESIGYDGDTLAVRFRTGGTYHYHGVSAETFSAMMEAKSVGSFLHRNIKPNYKFTKVSP